MTSPLTRAVIKSGLVSEGQLEEFKRWGMLFDRPAVVSKPKTMEEVATSIEEALESEGLVVSKDTDLDILQQYLHTQRPGILHVEVMTDDPTVESVADIPVNFGITTMREVILPWKSEGIEEELTNGMTYLTEVGSTTKIYFFGVRNLYFGSNKAFIVCIPRGVPETPALPSGEDHGSNESS